MTTELLGIVKVSSVLSNKIKAVTPEGFEYLCKFVLKNAPVIHGDGHNAEFILVSPKDSFFLLTGSSESQNDKTYSDLCIVVHGLLRRKDIQEVHEELMSWVRYISKRLRVNNLWMHLCQVGEEETINFQTWMRESFDPSVLENEVLNKCLSDEGVFRL